MSSKESRQNWSRLIALKLHFVRWAEDLNDTKIRTEFYPTVDKRHLFRDGYIARRSGHSR